MLKKVQVQAEHNNVKLDFEKDNGSTPLENRAFFPYNIKHYGLCQKMSFDLIKNGKFEDLGFSYSVDKCSCRGTTGYVLGPEYIKSDKMVYAKYGFVSNFVLNKNINETPIIISSKTFDYNECRKDNNILSEYFIPALNECNRETYKAMQELIIFSKNDEFNRYKQLLVSHEIFEKEFHMIINKNTVSIFTPEDKFEIKLPFILTKNKFEKRKTYNFNTYLYDLAFTFKNI